MVYSVTQHSKLAMGFVHMLINVGILLVLCMPNLCEFCVVLKYFLGPMVYVEYFKTLKTTEGIKFYWWPIVLEWTLLLWDLHFKLLTL